MAKKDLKFSQEEASMARERVDSLKEALGINSRINEEQRTQLSLTKQVAAQALDFIGKQEEGLRSTADIQKDLNKSITLQGKLNATIFDGRTKENKIVKDSLDVQDEIVKKKQAELQFAQKVDSSLGLAGKSLGVINKLFGNQLGITGDILKNSRARLAAQGDNINKVKGLGIVASETGKSLMKNLNDPLTYIKIALDYSDQINKFQKGLGLSYLEAASLRGEMTSIAAASGNMAINSTKIQKTFMSLNAEFGTASTTLATMFPEVVTQATQLQQLMGLSAKSTAAFASAAIRTGKSLKDIKEDSIGAVVAAEAETGARLNIKEVLDATGQVTGQIKAQLGANPEAIAKAVAVAKQFGMELKDIEATSKSLLNFESSIEAELEAELLTGKQLNLEKARLAALTGDYETLAREINKNVGDFSDFSKMNVLQQDALAKSLGMTSDQLSDQLLKKADLAALAQEARAMGDEDLAKQLEARSASQKFQDVVVKIQTIFADLVGGPLAGFVDLLGSALNILNPVFMVVGTIASTIAKMASFDFKNMNGLEKTVFAISAGLLAIKGTSLAINLAQKIGYELSFAKLLMEERISAIKTFQKVTGGQMNLIDQAAVFLGLKRAAGETLVNVGKKSGNRLGLGGMLRQAGQFILKMFTALPFPANLAVGALGAGIAAGLIGKFSKGDDVVSGGYGKRVLSTPEGSIALNNKDTIVAGTNLQQGDDVISAPAGSVSTSSPTIDYDKMAAAMSTIQVNSQMSYDPYAARSSQGGVFYGNQAKKNKLN